MSLGWQTESALLPSKAKPISIDSKSLLSLKAVVFDHEKKIESHKGSLSSDKYTRNRSIISSSKSSYDPMTRSNHGIDDRKNRDILQHKKDVKNESLVEASLRAKAKIYDEISSQQSLAASTSSTFLVNFQDKKHHPSSSSSSSSKKDQVDDDDDDVDDMVDIIDSFGRSRRVSKRNSEYSEYHQQQSAKKYKASISSSSSSHTCTYDDKYDDEKKRPSSSSSCAEQWAWSTGHYRDDAGEWIEEAIRDRGMKMLIEDRIDHEVNISSSSSSGMNMSLSQGARVKTMWEKTLDSSAREYLDDVHHQVEAHRSQQHHQHRHDVSHNTSSSSIGNDEMKSDVDERKELIRKKIEERKQRQLKPSSSS